MGDPRVHRGVSRRRPPHPRRAVPTSAAPAGAAAGRAPAGQPHADRARHRAARRRRTHQPGHRPLPGHEPGTVKSHLSHIYPKLGVESIRFSTHRTGADVPWGELPVASVSAGNRSMVVLPPAPPLVGIVTALGKSSRQCGPCSSGTAASAAWALLRRRDHHFQRGAFVA